MPILDRNDAFHHMQKQAENNLWEKRLPDGTQLIGEKGSGSHTHLGNNFVSIKDEKTEKHIHWKI